MNKLIHYSKILALGIILTFLLTACSKIQGPLESTPLLCYAVTIIVTNSLDRDIKDILIDGVNVGTIKSGETLMGICLDEIFIDMGAFPIIQITGE